MSTLDLWDENPLQLDVIPWSGGGTGNRVLRFQIEQGTDNGGLLVESSCQQKKGQILT